MFNNTSLVSFSQSMLSDKGANVSTSTSSTSSIIINGKVVHGKNYKSLTRGKNHAYVAEVYNNGTLKKKLGKSIDSKNYDVAYIENDKRRYSTEYKSKKTLPPSSSSNMKNNGIFSILNMTDNFNHNPFEDEFFANFFNPYIHNYTRKSRKESGRPIIEEIP